MVCGRDADGLGEVQTRCLKDRLGDAGTFQFQGLVTGCKNHISLLSKKNKINAFDANMLKCKIRIKKER